MKVIMIKKSKNEIWKEARLNSETSNNFKQYSFFELFLKTIIVLDLILTFLIIIDLFLNVHIIKAKVDLELYNHEFVAVKNYNHVEEFDLPNDIKIKNDDVVMLNYSPIFHIIKSYYLPEYSFHKNEMDLFWIFSGILNIVAFIFFIFSPKVLKILSEEDNAPFIYDIRLKPIIYIFPILFSLPYWYRLILYLNI